MTATLDGEPYATRITTRGLELIADEPADHGGMDLGMRPHELFIASLASCMAITMRMYAERKGWPGQGISVHASMDRSQHGREVNTTIDLDIRLPEGMTQEQRERMLQISKMCPVHRTLESPITLNANLAT